MLARAVNHRDISPELENYIPDILHGAKNVLIKKRYLTTKSDYQSFFVVNTSNEPVKSHTILYNGTPALRRFYSGIPDFVPAGSDCGKIEKYRDYVELLNEDVIGFLSEKLKLLQEPDNPMALYIIPELISNAVKSNYIIEKKLTAGNSRNTGYQSCMLEVVCLDNRKKPEYIDLIMRNYARFHPDIERRIEAALTCRWTKREKFKQEKIHRQDCESSNYGLPSINNAIRKFYNGELFYDGYDDSYADFGAYQFTMRLPKEQTCKI